MLRARAIEQRLYDEPWRSDAKVLLPRLQTLDLPGLVLHGEHDLVPVALPARVAEALPRGRLRMLEATGHFAYREAPDAFVADVTAFLETG